MGLFKSSKSKEVEILKEELLSLKQENAIQKQQIESLSSKVDTLQRENDSLNENIEGLNEQIERRNAKSNELREKNKKENDAKQQQREEEEKRRQQLASEKAEALDTYYQNLGGYYEFKSSVFEYYEQAMYYCLTTWFARKFKDKNTYFVFPKLRLADIMNTTQNEENEAFKSKYNDDHPMVFEITSKHIDFTICKRVGEAREIKYKPVLFIELNGTSHQENERTIRNDAFKKELFEKMGTPIITFENDDLKNCKSFISGKLTEVLEKHIQTD